MKRIFTLLLVVVAFAGYSQNKFDVLASENFDGGALPAGWAIYNVDGLTPSANTAVITDAWLPFEIFAAGNFSMVSTSWYTPAGTADDWLCSSAIDLTGFTAADYEKIAVNFSAMAWNAGYPDGFEVYATSAGQTVEDFLAGERLLTVAEENTSLTSRTVDITSYLGEMVYIGIRNNSTDKWYLVVDDFAVIGISGYDAQFTGTEFKVYNQIGSTDVLVSGFNLSAADVDNIGVSYSIDGATPVPASINIGGVGALEAFEGSLSIPLAAPGASSVSVTVNDLDGNAIEGLDPINFEVSVIDGANEVTRRGFIETFTSSTCAPCTPGNENLHTLLDGLSEAEYPVVIKFQQPFPGVGDGYMTEESDNRRTYYGIGGIPNTRINGSDLAINTNGLIASHLTASNDATGYFDIEAIYDIDVENKTVSISGSYTPQSEVVADTRLLIAIQETRTENNVGDNGETEFFDVFKKFIGNSQGIAIDAGITVGEAVEFQYSYTFQGNYRDPVDASNPINNATENSVENFENLEVSLWVESIADQRVLSAEKAVFMPVGVDDVANINDVTIFPNPVNEMLNITIDVQDANSARFELTDVEGRLIRTLSNLELAQGTQTYSFDISDLQTGLYYISITNSLGAIYKPVVKK